MKKIVFFALLALFCAGAFGTAESAASDDSFFISDELEGTWIWKSPEGDGYFETNMYTFGKDGVLHIEEHLPGKKIHKAAGTYQSDGRRLRVTITSRAFDFDEKTPAIFPYAHEGDVLAVCIEGQVYIFLKTKR